MKTNLNLNVDFDVAKSLQALPKVIYALIAALSFLGLGGYVLS